MSDFLVFVEVLFEAAHTFEVAMCAWRMLGHPDVVNYGKYQCKLRTMGGYSEFQFTEQIYVAAPGTGMTRRFARPGNLPPVMVCDGHKFWWSAENVGVRHAYEQYWDPCSGKIVPVQAQSC